MTTLTPTPPDVGTPNVIKVPLRPYLEGLHEQWRQEVARVLDPARADAGGTWRRWHAIDYLRSGFRRRVERERRAVASLHHRLTGDEASHLWAGGELLAQLVDSLGYRVGLCQNDAQFASVTLAVTNALEYWCRQVEDALGPVRWGEVSPESRALLETITYDEVLQGG
jgi:hypothetical protein